MISRSFISVLVLSLAGCASYSPYAIDDKWMVPVNDDITGIWKAIEDSNKKDYILVQRSADLLQELLDKKIDSFDIATFGEETTKEIVASATRDLQAQVAENRAYFLTRFGYNGTSANYQQWHAYMSEVGGVRFLNVQYRNAEKEIKGEMAEHGFFFLRMLKVSKDTIITALVADTTLKDLKSAASVRERITAHLNDNRFYSDTLHFYLVNKTHSKFRGSGALANGEK